MLKIKGARVIAKNHFSTVFGATDGNLTRRYLFLDFQLPVLLLFLSFHINYNYFNFFLQNVYQCLISIRIIQNNSGNKNGMIIGINTGRPI